MSKINLEDNDDINVMEDGDDSLKIVDLNIDAQTILISLHNLKVAIKNIEGNVRHYQKETIKYIRSLKKNQKSKVVKKGMDMDKMDREPSGFAKKTRIDKKLLDFLRLPEVMEVTDKIMSEEDKKENSKFSPLDDEGMINRPSVTKIINRYIKENNLTNPSAGKLILPDENLKKILGKLEANDKKRDHGYTFFTLQRYIKHLFI